MARLQTHINLRLSAHSLQKGASVPGEELCVPVLQARNRRRGQSCSGTLTFSLDALVVSGIACRGMHADMDGTPQHPTSIHRRIWRKCCFAATTTRRVPCDSQQAFRTSQRCAVFSQWCVLTTSRRFFTHDMFRRAHCLGWRWYVLYCVDRRNCGLNHLDGMIIIWAPSSTPPPMTYGSDLSTEDLQYEKEHWKPRTTFRSVLPLVHLH